MKLEQLRQVMAVSRAGSMNAAAKTLFMAQSTLSASIRALERELGQPIFARSTSGVQPTVFGRALCSRAAEMLRLEEEIRQAAQGGSRPQLRVGAYYLLFASRLFGEFCARLGEGAAELYFVEESRTNVVAGVADGHLELGVLTMPQLQKEQWQSRIEEQGLTYTKITTEDLFIFCGTGSRLYESQKSELELGELQEFPLILFPEQDALFDAINTRLRHCLPCRGGISVSGRGALQNVYQQTGGVYLGVHNKNAYRDKPYYISNRWFRLLDAPCAMEIGVVTRQGQPLQALAQAYLDEMTQLLQG